MSGIVSFGRDSSQTSSRENLTSEFFVMISRLTVEIIRGDLLELIERNQLFRE
jgi:hypothetical protein